MKDWLRPALTAAILKACPARLTSLGPRPESFFCPLMRVPGARDNQEQKCLLSGNRERSGPISEAMVKAVSTPIVGMAVMSTPRVRRIAVCVKRSSIERAGFARGIM